VAIRWQARKLHVHSMGEYRVGYRRALLQHLLAGLIGRHKPAHGHAVGGHAAISLQGLGRQARPQHGAIGAGLAAGHAQREGAGWRHPGRGRDRLGLRLRKVG